MTADTPTQISSVQVLSAVAPPVSEAHVLAEVHGRVGFITLNRGRALNALSLDMVRNFTQTLLTWRDDPAVLAVAVRGSGKEGAFSSFCAGGDIRFFHQAALAGDPRLEDFFTEEYRLNHLIHTYPKPYIAFMDGVVMGGGMGISQGASLRVVPNAPKWPCPRPASVCFRMWAVDFFSAVVPVEWASGLP